MKKFFMFLVLLTFTTIQASNLIPTQEEVTKLYVATFNRAPDSAGLSYWVNDSGLTLEGIAQSFFDQPETQTLYPSSTTNREFVRSVYLNLFNREPDSAGWDYWEAELNEQKYTRNLFIQTVIAGAKDSTDSLDETILKNKTSVGLQFIAEGLTDTDAAKEVLSYVSSSTESVTEALNFLEEYKNTTTGTKIKVISHIDAIGDISTLATRDDTIYLGSNSDGKFYIVDVSDKTKPTIKGSVKLDDINIEDIALDPSNSNRVLVADDEAGLVVIDVSNPSSPTIFKTIDTSGYARALFVKDSIIYIASGYSGILMYDLSTYEKLTYIAGDGSTKSSIPVVGDYTDTIELYSDYIFTSDAYSKYITVTSALTKEQVSTIEKSQNNYEARDDITIDGDTMYVADSSSGLMIFDISNLPTVSLLSTVSPSKDGYSFNVTLSSDKTKAYVCSSYPGVEVYDISDKSSPKLIEAIDTTGNAFESALSSDGNYLYVADRTGGLQIMELSSASSPSTTTSSYMDISKWDIYGTASLSDGVFTIGDDIGYDVDDIDGDENIWNHYADAASPQYDYDAIVAKKTFTPPVDLKFSGTLSTTSYGYNEIGFTYPNDYFDGVMGHGAPVGTRLAEFSYHWESGNILDFYIDKVGYVSSNSSFLNGVFEINWDGSTVRFYHNDELLYQKELLYDDSKKVMVYFRNYETPFVITDIEISSSATTTTSTGTTLIDGTTWVDAEPDGEFDFSEAKAYCENLGYRLPTAQELVSVWNFYGGTPSPQGFEKGTFYWGSKGEWCAMDYDCSVAEIGPLDGFGHPKCVVP